MSRTFDILTEAREYLITDGWVQKTFSDDDNKRVCAIGAIRKAVVIEQVDAEKMLLRALEVIDPGAIQRSAPVPLLPNELVPLSIWESIARWNDQPGRTKEEVIALYDQAINMLKEDNHGGT